VIFKERAKCLQKDKEGIEECLKCERTSSYKIKEGTVFPEDRGIYMNHIIISKTPFRISFAGGGTDLPAYYTKSSKGGSVISSAIDKFFYIAIKKSYDQYFRVKYNQIEKVEDITHIKHDLVRECLIKTNIIKPVEIVMFSDIPSSGSGLGSSSSVTVGLLNAMYAYKASRGESELEHDHAQVQYPKQLAEEACEVEIDILGKTIGKQDQYIAAYGGMQEITFNRDNTVDVVKFGFLNSATETFFKRSSMLFDLGGSRKSEEILKKVVDTISYKTELFDRLLALKEDIKYSMQNGYFDKFAGELDNSWEIKRNTNELVTNDEIDGIYKQARFAGAMGGKLCGAGGGGHLFLICYPEKQKQVREVMSGMGLREVVFRLYEGGSGIYVI